MARGGLGLTAGQQAPFQLVLNFGGMAGLLLAGFFSDRWGRRPAFAVFCLLGVAGYGCLFALTRSGGHPAGLLAVFTAICLSFGIGGVLASLASELFPTHLRSTGPGVCQNLGKGIGGMLGPTLAGALVPRLGYAPVLALPGACLAALALLIWMLPEVGGREVRALEGDSFLVGDRPRPQ